MKTLDKYKRLRKAIKLAKGKGECKYLDKGQPACVIAQLAHLEGISNSEMVAWGNANVMSLPLYASKPLPATKLADNYELSFLNKLQQMWDRMKDVSEFKAKEAMRKYVNEQFGVKE